MSNVKRVLSRLSPVAKDNGMQRWGGNEASEEGSSHILLAVGKCQDDQNPELALKSLYIAIAHDAEVAQQGGS